MIKSNIDQSSESEFSIGVPVSANLCSARSSLTDCALSEAAFFMN